MTKTLTYSEMLHYSTLEDRFRYLKLGGKVGEETFGFDRWMNQRFYRSREWKDIRTYVITRDEGMDLGVRDTPIFGNILVHHMNPITVEHISISSDFLLNPEYLITTSMRTHNAIHYGNEDLLPKPIVQRAPGDTLLW